MTKTRQFVRKLIATMVAGGAALAAGGAHAVSTNLHEFRIDRNAASGWWLDTFGDGLAPPSSPVIGGFACGSSCYNVFGVYGSGAESGNRLQLDSTQGGLTQNAEGAARLLQRTRLETNIDSGDTTRGLKRNHTFEVSGVFDLVIPSADNAGYGVRLADISGTNTGNDVLQWFVLRDGSGNNVIRLNEQDFLTNQVSMVGSVSVSASDGDKVRLVLAHDAANTDDIHARYEFYKNGAWQGMQTLPQTGAIFNGEAYTRAEFLAFQAPVPEPESYALMLTGLGLLGWQLRRRARRSATAALV